MNCNLNRKIFDSDNVLLPKVKQILLKIRDDIIKDLKEEHNFNFEYIAYILSGSLTGPNYDRNSDFDLHFLIDFNDYSDNQKSLVKDYFMLYKEIFNRNEFELLGYKIEIYFQDIIEPHTSPGIYDIEKDIWLKEPDCVNIHLKPEQIEAVSKFSKEINAFVEIFNNREYNNLDSFLNELKDYTKSLKEYRMKGQASKLGQYSDQNIVFKQLRRSGDLEKLSNLKKQVKQKLYSI